jgi:hypothetical protein
VKPVLKAIDPVRQKFADQLFAALDDQEQEQLTRFIVERNAIKSIGISARVVASIAP